MIELAARMQLGHDDFSRAAMKLVVFMYAYGNSPPIVGNGNTVVGMDHDDDVVAVSRQGFIESVVDDFEHHMLKARAIGRIANVHTRERTSDREGKRVTVRVDLGGR